MAQQIRPTRLIAGDYAEDADIRLDPQTAAEDLITVTPPIGDEFTFAIEVTLIDTDNIAKYFGCPVRNQQWCPHFVQGRFAAQE